ncbi:MAG: SUMF1/EgtB/PvdO family nonheme iron enzyme [Myxococcales bacterium]|nr:SUMF1/EgtB/PvdO family nonheme iron enzyme [Myxococcales bacterium]MCB9645048.1 SUMF1/EgtB/PvdO family nonheme iron enzyme [Deltaproteobacteria bacterium]
MRYAVALAPLALFGLATACVESQTAPNIPVQTTVAYGQRLYLVDTTPGAPPSGDLCTRFGPVSTATTGFATNIDPDVPHNCFVVLEPTAPRAERTLRVDAVEVTNDLFQLCVDSGACAGPDPSKSSKSQVCQVADEFNECPVVEVSQREASNFCRWIGRRLPSSMEHIIMRQAAQADSQTPDTLTAYPTGDDAPATCDDAVLGTAGCMATKPRAVLDGNGAPVGGAPRDVVEGEDGQQIFDLTGNLSEWSSDLFPPRRGGEGDLPWFCVASLTMTSTIPIGPSNPPECPVGATCVYGQYRLADGEPMAIWPVCITTDNGRFNGVIGAVHGGSHKDETPDPDAIGIYGRKTEADPQELSDTSRARGYGVRCVGNRESAGEDGTLPEFDDMFTLGRL